jgi:hypothetical protein
MKTRALLLALPALLLASCHVDNRASVDVQGICFPAANCTFTSTCDAFTIGAVTMDVALTSRVELFLQVANQMASNANPATGKLNTADAHIDQVAVAYTGIPVPAISYDVTNQYVPANGTAVIGVFSVYPSAATYAALLAAVPPGTSSPLVANLRLRGYRDDGTRFETGEFSTAIQVCNGCLSSSPCSAGKSACPSVGIDPISCGTVGG